MALRKAQNSITIIFLALMVLNIIGGLSLYDSEASIIIIYLKAYGIPLSIILAFYFSQKRSELKTVPKFRFILLLFLIFLWNGSILAFSISSIDDMGILASELARFPEYGNILIAGGIVWLFNGN